MLFKLAAEAGARAGELYALTVDDLLFEHNVIRINKSMYRQKVGSPETKNATRWVNVKAYVMAMLKEHLNGRTNGLVFLSKRNTPLINSTVLNKHLHPVLRKLGLEPRIQTPPGQHFSHGGNVDWGYQEVDRSR